MKEMTVQLYLDSNYLVHDCNYKDHKMNVFIKGFATFLQTEKFIDYGKSNSSLKFHEAMDVFTSELLQKVCVTFQQIVYDKEISLFQIEKEKAHTIKMHLSLEIRKFMFETFGLKLIEFYPEFNLDKTDPNFTAFQKFYVKKITSR